MSWAVRIAISWLVVLIAFIPLWAWILQDRRREEREYERRELERRRRLAALSAERTRDIEYRRRFDAIVAAGWNDDT